MSKNQWPISKSHPTTFALKEKFLDWPEFLWDKGCWMVGWFIVGSWLCSRRTKPSRSSLSCDFYRISPHHPPSLSLSLSLSFFLYLSLPYTHTHTHTHSLSLSLSLIIYFSWSLSLSNSFNFSHRFFLSSLSLFFSPRYISLFSFLYSHSFLISLCQFSSFYLSLTFSLFF